MGRIEGKSPGFTLLEVIIAVLISFLLIFTASLALRAYIDSQKNIEESLSKSGKKNLFIYFFFKQLQNIPSEVDLVRDLKFEGDSSSLKFVSYIPVTGRFFPGIFGVEYKIEGGRVLERDVPLIAREDVLDFFKNSFEEGNFTVVYSPDVKVLSFAYYNGVRWVDEWKSLNTFPLAIRLNLENGTALSIPVSVASRVN